MPTSLKLSPGHFVKPLNLLSQIVNLLFAASALAAISTLVSQKYCSVDGEGQKIAGL
jgi:hypothetical protein